MPAINCFLAVLKHYFTQYNQPKHGVYLEDKMGPFYVYIVGLKFRVFQNYKKRYQKSKILGDRKKENIFIINLILFIYQAVLYTSKQGSLKTGYQHASC